MIRNLVMLSLVALIVTGCAAFGMGRSSLDAAAVEQNRTNVEQIATENGRYIDADPALTPALKQAAKDRNAAAVLLATKLSESVVR